MGFLTAFATDFGILLLLTSPVLYLAWRRGGKRTAKRLVIAAGSVALLTAVTAATSAILVDQCQSAPGVDIRDCVDYGSAGMRLVMIVIYVVVIWARGLALLNE